MKNIQEFDGKVKATGIETDALFYTEIATNGLVIENGIVTDYNGTATEVTIPDYFGGVAVTIIDVSAFYEHTEIKAVRFPKYLAHIGTSAFYGCTGLVSIDLGDNIATIGANAFVGCTSLEAVTIGTTTLPICTGAFAITDNQTCHLYRPVEVVDKDTWTSTFNAMGFASVNFKTENGAVEYALKASYDGNGDHIVSTYAKTNGTYPSMTVGTSYTAVNADKASTTSFDNNLFKQCTSPQTLTAGTYQFLYKTAISGTPINANLGVVYFDGINTATAYAQANIGGGSTTKYFYLVIDTNGNVTINDGTTTLDITDLYYKVIN